MVVGQCPTQSPIQKHPIKKQRISGKGSRGSGEERWANCQQSLSLWRMQPPSGASSGPLVLSGRPNHPTDRAEQVGNGPLERQKGKNQLDKSKVGEKKSSGWGKGFSVVQRDGSEIKSTGCFSRGTGFHSYTHMAAHNYLNSSAWDPVTSSGLHEPRGTNDVHRHTCSKIFMHMK